MKGASSFPHVELRALIGEAHMPPRGAFYALSLNGQDLLVLDDIGGTLQAVRMGCRLRSLPEPLAGTYARITVVHAPRRMVHVGRVRWSADEVGRWMGRSLARLDSLPLCPAWPVAELAPVWVDMPGWGARHAA